MSDQLRAAAALSWKGALVTISIVDSEPVRELFR
jgi:hypothetical protein